MTKLYCKKYNEYMQSQQEKKLPEVDINKLKTILKTCRRDCPCRKGITGGGEEEEEALAVPKCTDRCPVCDGSSFFPSLLNGMSEVVAYFNDRARKLIELHRASSFKKYFLSFKTKLRGQQHIDHIQEGKDLVTYALITSTVIHKILEKYDKIHYSKQGQLFKSRAQSMHVEILRSPWLLELMAFHINLREAKSESMNKESHNSFDGYYLTFRDNKPSLTFEHFDSTKLDIELTCSICLDTVFDPVCLTCGHIFCYTCACSSASVAIVDGLKASNSAAKCPLCRVGGVYQGAVRLEELNILLGRSCQEYWEQRLQTERIERVKQIKEYWESQCRAFIGV
ncbi:probable E3 ubiquitin-protein ligase BAH1-like 1 isoform X1 [Prosopis cineraria]|uniref:probable E3 ubiquitin-protein ligase BAH1-like 1 isoform X1 n=1 Tax=Prosopis cineraria TaxID=364024 RepID=UPI00240EE2FD|nr:probable E3 ubiquitin-protein ligase BAH1-like 1 isoform X1 [Prosopis cineraria]